MREKNLRAIFQTGLFFALAFLFLSAAAPQKAAATNPWITVDNVYVSSTYTYVEWTLNALPSFGNPPNVWAIVPSLNAPTSTGHAGSQSLNRSLDMNWAYPNTAILQNPPCNASGDDSSDYSVSSSYTTRFPSVYDAFSETFRDPDPGIDSLYLSFFTNSVGCNFDGGASASYDGGYEIAAGTGSNSISFPYLSNGNSYADMSFITVQTSFSSSTTEMPDGRVSLYITTSTPNDAYITINAIVYNGGSENRNTTFSLESPLYLGTSTTWYVYAYLYSPGYGTLLASSSISFTVDSQNSGQTENELCGVFPFAYVCDLKDIFSGFRASSTANFPTLQLSFGGLIPTSTVFSSGTITYFLGNEKIQLFRTLIGYALWITFAYLIYHRSKNAIYKEK